MKLLNGFFKWATDGKIIVLRAAEQNNTVWAERVDHWQIEGKWIEVPVVGIFDMHEGKVVHWNEYLDFGYMAQFTTRPDDFIKR